MGNDKKKQKTQGCVSVRSQHPVKKRVVQSAVVSPSRVTSFELTTVYATHGNTRRIEHKPRGGEREREKGTHEQTLKAFPSPVLSPFRFRPLHTRSEKIYHYYVSFLLQNNWPKTTITRPPFRVDKHV